MRLDAGRLEVRVRELSARMSSVRRRGVPTTHRESGGQRHRMVAFVAALVAVLALAVWLAAGLGTSTTAVAAGQATFAPTGLYVVNDASNERPVSQAYSPSSSQLFNASSYQQGVSGLAIFVPIAQVLAPVTKKWGRFQWDWSYIDTLAGDAISAHKRFSLAFEVGYQAPTSPPTSPPPSTYLKSLPAGFASMCDAAAGQTCAPLFDVWLNGGHAGGRCVSAYIPLPWVKAVQLFWKDLAGALSTHLKHTFVDGQSEYSALTLVHVPGLSVYDEEVRVPAVPYPSKPKGSPVPCPDATKPASSIPQSLMLLSSKYGYSEQSVESGFETIAGYFASAFRDKYLALSIFPGTAFPGGRSDAIEQQIISTLAGLTRGNLLLQSDDLDLSSDKAAEHAMQRLTAVARANKVHVSFQSNKRGSQGAACDKRTCLPDTTNGAYAQLLSNGKTLGASYIEVWSYDVVNYPTAVCAVARCTPPPPPPAPKPPSPHPQPSPCPPHKPGTPNTCQ